MTVFGHEMTVCVSNDHVGLKFSTSKCCDCDIENVTSINNSTDRCFECKDFPLLCSSTSDQHISPVTKTINYSSLKEKVQFNLGSFVDLRVIHKNQLRSSTIDKLTPTGALAFLRALRTVSLLI